MPSDLLSRLSAPFPASDVSWKPIVFSKDQTSCLPFAYLTARAVMDRLDEVLGIDGWETSYRSVSPSNVECRLTVFVGDKAIVRADVGDVSEQPKEGDRIKAAYSDALKRAAVQFGVGRYLYRLKSNWVPYDAAKKLITQTPALPAWALPEGSTDQQQSARQSRQQHSPPVGGIDVSPPVGGIDVWVRFLERMPTLDLLNIKLRDLSGLEDTLKKTAWHLCLAYAKDRGWEFDPIDKRFCIVVDA